MHILRIHPALKSSRRGPVVGSTPLHLRQSDLDGACGPHCMLMALMILGILKRGDLEILPKAKSRSMSQLWWATERNFFSGTTTSELHCMIEPYEKQVETRVFRRNQFERMTETIERNGIAVVCIYNDLMSHWVLAVGVGGSDYVEEDATTDNILILDPGHGSIPLAAWNATLNVRSDAQGRHIYDTRNSRSKVYVGQAIALSRKV